MEKTVGTVFLLVALTACLSQEVVVVLSRDCLGIKTATVEFQTIQVDEGFNYNRNYIDESCHDSFNATNLGGANVAECALNSYAAKANSFTFADNDCVGYSFWQANLTDCRIDEGQEGGILLYLADSQLSKYLACPPRSVRTSIGCVFTTDLVPFTDGSSTCNGLGASFYSAQSIEEFVTLQTELLAVTGFYPYPAVNLQLINQTWIWQGTGVEQPVEQQYWSNLVEDLGDDSCAVIERPKGYSLLDTGCDTSNALLCVITE